jgi:YesN/AraC family two-component response regulator
MDISMPIMRGVDAVKEIVNADPQAKIIIISALNQKQMVFEALNNGAKHYVIKPIVPSKVLGIVNEVLKNQEEIEAKPQPVEKEKDSHLPGFNIQNCNGKFVFSFNSYLAGKDFSGLETAINGLIFISPLNVVFNFDKLEKSQEDILIQLKRLANKIKEVGGNLEILSEDTELKSKFL